MPGGSVVVKGDGCAPGSDVALFIDGRPAGAVTASARGAFVASLTPQGVGPTTLTASCGSKRFTAVVNVVATAASSMPEGAAAVFGIFVLLGAVLIRGQFGGGASRRRRRRQGAADILEGGG